MLVLCFSDFSDFDDSGAELELIIVEETTGIDEEEIDGILVVIVEETMLVIAEDEPDGNVELTVEVMTVDMAEEEFDGVTIEAELDRGTDDDVCGERDELTGLVFVEEPMLEAVDVAELDCDFEVSVDNAEDVDVELIAILDDPAGVEAFVDVCVKVFELVSLDLGRSLEL